MKNKNLKYIIASVVILIAALTVATSIIVSYRYIGAEKISAYFSYFSFPEDFDANRKPMTTENFDNLNETQKKAYICIFNQIKDHPAYIKVPSLTSDEFTEVYFSVKNDNPDILCFSDSCNMVSFYSSCMLQMNYDYEKNSCEEKTRQMLKESERIISQMPILESDYEKELYIHDYIANHCRYEDTTDASNAYGCLISGRAVCSGYSRAALLLFAQLGIRSTLISGEGKTETGYISHMWNIVWLDNEPYHLDITWDDPGTEDSAAISHIYFNVTSDKISTDHKNFSTYIDCSATKYNYFILNNTSFDEYSAETLDMICKLTAENINKGKKFSEFIFTTDEAYNSAVEAIIDNVTSDSDTYKIVGYVEKNTNDIVDTSHVNFSTDNNNKYIKIKFDFK